MMEFIRKPLYDQIFVILLAGTYLGLFIAEIILTDYFSAQKPFGLDYALIAILGLFLVDNCLQTLTYRLIYFK